VYNHTLWELYATNTWQPAPYSRTTTPTNWQ
jgi:hypothetical protein